MGLVRCIWYDSVIRKEHNMKKLLALSLALIALLSNAQYVAPQVVTTVSPPVVTTATHIYPGSSYYGGPIGVYSPNSTVYAGYAQTYGGVYVHTPVFTPVPLPPVHCHVPNYGRLHYSSYRPPVHHHVPNCGRPYGHPGHHGPRPGGFRGGPRHGGWHRR